MNLMQKVLTAGVILWILLIAANVQAQTEEQGVTTQQPEATRQQAPAPLDGATEESMIVFSMGLTELKAGRTEEAIEQLKEAIRYRPDKALYRYVLADAYKRAEMWPNRWFQLRQAVLLKPDFPEAIRELLEMWQVALNKGALDIGNSTKQVEEALGKPDQVQTEGEVTSWQYAFMDVRFKADRLSSVLDLRAMVNLEAPLEVLEFGFDDRPWQLNQQRIEVGRSVLEYQPEEVAKSEESYTIERLFDLKKDMTANELMNNMHDNLLKQYPDVNWTVLKEEDGDVLFEWSRSVDGKSAQHELTRLISGEKDIHRLAYTAHEINERDAWLKILSQAKLSRE